jgi:hypothetical protein
MNTIVPATNHPSAASAFTVGSRIGLALHPCARYHTYMYV